VPLMSSKFTVEFRIYGKALDPGAVTELLALEPCQVVLPVTRRGSRVVEEAMWAFNGSEDGEASSLEWSTLEEGLKSVLEKCATLLLSTTAPAGKFGGAVSFTPVEQRNSATCGFTFGIG